MNIDETHIKIINQIIDNPKLSVREISKGTGVSAVTVLKRIKELEKNKIIRSYTTLIDYSKIGFVLDVIIKIRVSKGKLTEVGEKLVIDKHVLSIFDITGDFDIMLIAKFKSRTSLDKFVKRIQTLSHVERTKTTLILNTIKDERIKI